MFGWPFNYSWARLRCLQNLLTSSRVSHLAGRRWAANTFNCPVPIFLAKSAKSDFRIQIYRLYFQPSVSQSFCFLNLSIYVSQHYCVNKSNIRAAHNKISILYWDLQLR